MAATAGCAADRAEPARTEQTPLPSPAPVPQTREATAPQRPAAERIADDPVAFLEDVYQRANALDQYRLTFYRQERLGLIPRLGPMEKIEAAFRKTPFSVKFVWENEDPDYWESVYVEARNNNKLIVRERKGVLGLPPVTRTLDVNDPVKLGRGKNPITDFGLAQVARRSLLPFQDPDIARVMTIGYRGIVNLEPINRPAHHLRVERPAVKDIRYTRQDFYVDTETLLPSGTDLYTPNGKLDALYRYTNVRTDVRLTDADFAMGRTGAVTKR